MRYSYALIAIIATATTLSAQVAVPVGAQSSSSPHLSGPVPDSSYRVRDPKHLNRLVPAAFIGIASAVALGTATYAIADCSGDDCYGAMFGLALPAALFGGIVGSAVGAAAPRGRGLCTGMQRFGMGLGGAFLGALAGLPLAYVSGPFGMFVTVPTGSVLFMRRC
jgi:hypothetical protein